MKKSYWTIGVVIIILIVIAIVSGGGEKEPVAGEPIKIGTVLALSGNVASLSERVHNAIEFAVDEVNKKYPFNLEVISEDTQGDVTVAVSAINKLINIDGVNIIIGAIRSNNTLAIAPIAEENKVILMTPVSSAEDITSAGDYIFRNRETAKSHGVGIAEFLFNSGATKTALFTANSANSKSYSESFKNRFEDLGGSVLFKVDYIEDTIDFRTDIRKALASDIDAIYIANALGNDGGILLRQIRELGFDGMVTMSVAVESDEFVDAAREASEGLIYSFQAFDPNDPTVSKYAKGYKERFGMESDGFAANGYDAINIIAMAIDGCGGTDVDTDCIRDFLYDVKDYPGVGGLTTFDENGDADKPIQIKTIKDGEFVKYEG